jgi:hypothetical protein
MSTTILPSVRRHTRQVPDGFSVALSGLGKSDACARKHDTMAPRRHSFHNYAFRGTSSLQGKVAMITVGITGLVLASDKASSTTGTELVDGRYIVA